MVFLVNIKSCFGIFGCIFFFKLLSGKNTQKGDEQKIWDAQNWVSDELTEIHISNGEVNLK